MQNYKCDACFGERNYGNYLEGEELFLCTQKMKLKHLEDVHNPDKPYLCAEKDCFRCFDTNERLSDHSYICLHVLDRITTEENRQRIIIGADTQRQLVCIYYFIGYYPYSSSHRWYDSVEVTVVRPGMNKTLL